jgi:protein SCO1/2
MKLQFRYVELILLVLLAGTPQRASAQAAKVQPEPTRPNVVKTPYRGGLVDPPLTKPKFTLTDTTGSSFDFTSKTQGYITLLFFGYTHCPDMCPAQMSMIGSAFRKLSPEIAAQFKVVFVTTDPARDDSRALRSWLDHFDTRFIGLTGSDAAIRAAQIASDLPVAEKSAVRPDGNYDVGHASFVLAYTKDNLAHVIYPVGVKLEDLSHDLPLLIKETWGR